MILQSLEPMIYHWTPGAASIQCDRQESVCGVQACWYFSNLFHFLRPRNRCPECVAAVEALFLAGLAFNDDLNESLAEVFA